MRRHSTSPSSFAEASSIVAKQRHVVRARETAVVGVRTYVLIDGKNLDTTLGASVLQRAPKSAERRRRERVLEFARTLDSDEVVGLFFINSTSGHTPWLFVAAIQNVGSAVLLSDTGSEKVVDGGIQLTLEALTKRIDPVLLGSHDRDFLPQGEGLLDAGTSVAMLGFPEMMSGVYAELGTHTQDLEFDAKAVYERLPRICIMPLTEFDPED